MYWGWVRETQFTPQHLGLPPSDHLTVGWGRRGWGVHISVFQGQLFWSYYILCFMLSFYCSFSYKVPSVIGILVYFIISYFAGNAFFNWFFLLEMPHKQSYYSVSKLWLLVWPAISSVPMSVPDAHITKPLVVILSLLWATVSAFILHTQHSLL